MAFKYGSYTPKAKGQQGQQYAFFESQGKNYEGVREINRPVDYTLEHETRPLPDWMRDPSLLPKKPPGRT